MAGDTETASEGIGYRALTLRSATEFNPPLSVLIPKYSVCKREFPLQDYPLVYRVHSSDFSTVRNDLLWNFLHNEVLHSISLSSEGSCTLLFLIENVDQIDTVRKMVRYLIRTGLNRLLHISWCGYTHTPAEIVIPWLLAQSDPQFSQRSCSDIVAIMPYEQETKCTLKMMQVFKPEGLQLLLNYADEVNF